MLVKQSNCLFISLTIKQRELAMLKTEMRKDMHDGNTTSTTFNDLDVLIESLKQLSAYRASLFGVTAENLKND